MATLSETFALADQLVAINARNVAALDALAAKAKAIDPKSANAQSLLFSIQQQIDAQINKTRSEQYTATQALFAASDTLSASDFQFYNNSKTADAAEASLRAISPAIDEAKYEASTKQNALKAAGTNSPTIAAPASTATPPTKTTSAPATTSAPTTTATTSTTAKPTAKPVTTSAPTTTAAGNAAPVPSAISTIIGADEPLISSDQIKADIANIQVDLPPLPNIEEEVVTFAAQQDATAFEAKADWRVRLSLSPDANYLYRADDPGILSPLAATDGVVFPYTPTISLNYVANYDPTTLVHSNYKVYQYSSSSVEQVSIACEFTAQDVYEANYLLAVIHFFRSMTKMFYGQDEDPRRGTPPPLCYMFGMGNYQFSAHPLAITGFTYNLPNNVDYIKTVGETFTGIPQPSGKLGTAVNRLLGTGVAVGGKKPKATLNNPPNSTGEATWVPTQIQIQITCLPIQTRNMVSNVFSLKEYATGSLLNGTRSGATGGGFW